MAKVILILLFALILIPFTLAYYGYSSPTGGSSVVYSNVTVNVSHESLNGLLGGGANDHYHITGAQHTSLLSGLTSWITNTVNDLTNYFTKSQTEAYINANVSSYAVHLTGDTMTGNLNMSGSNISIDSGNKFCYTQACDKYSFFNGTQIIIQG